MLREMGMTFWLPEAEAELARADGAGPHLVDEADRMRRMTLLAGPRPGRLGRRRWRTPTRFGRLDILVAAAGIVGPNKPSWEWTEQETERVLAVNLKGVFHCMQAAVVPMRERKSGAIVSIASIAGKEGNANQSIYSASKAAVISLTKSLGKEVATDDVRVNCVASALIDTPITEPSSLPPAHREASIARVPMGRPGRAEEVAAVIAFLCSDDASFVTAQCYDVSGGRSVF
jgi:2-dehydro-3-deoxy-L-rhamnonate dehydrogenase (NAD+)